MISWLTLIVLALATMRLTRLAVADKITEPIRVWIVAKADAAWVEDLLTCPWCVGFWISAATVAITWWWHSPLWLLFLTIFAIAEVVGLASRADKGY